MAATSTLTAHQPNDTAPAPAPAAKPPAAPATGTAGTLGGRHRAAGTARRTNRGPGRHRAEAASRIQPAARAAIGVISHRPPAAGRAAAGVASRPYPPAAA